MWLCERRRGHFRYGRLSEKEPRGQSFDIWDPYFVALGGSSERGPRGRRGGRAAIGRGLLCAPTALLFATVLEWQELPQSCHSEPGLEAAIRGAFTLPELGRVPQLSARAGSLAFPFARSSLNLWGLEV
jgi:hypothetical protein